MEENEQKIILNEDQTSLEPVQSELSKSNAKQSIFPWVVTILIAAWLIGISILGAGWLISKEISKQNNSLVGDSAILPNTPIDLTIPDSYPTLGEKDAKVTVVEFADYQCPFCGEWQKTIFPKLKSEYIDTGKVKFVYWDLPFLGEESFKTAEAAMCAKDQNKFWEFHDLIFNNQSGENEGAFTDDNLKSFATKSGLKLLEFNSCFDARIYKPMIEEAAAQASSYGVNSTPTVFINGLRFEGVMPYENYKQIIETELAK